MEKTLKKLFSIAALISVAATMADHTRVATFYNARSQGTNAARWLVGTTGHMYHYEMDKHNGTISLTPEYTRTFKSDRISECLFGACGDIKIKGSAVIGATPGATDWLADWFYLPEDFDGTISFHPRIQNFIADFDFYWGMDKWYEGLYFRLHAPIVWTKWDLRCCENVANAGTAGTWFGAQGLTTLTSFLAYARGQEKLGNFTDIGVNFTPQALQCAKLCCDDTKVRLADLRAYLGWNFAQDEDYHFGLNAQIAAPTGNRPKGEFIFEPMVGNGHHWEFGGGLTGHYVFWRGEEADNHFGLYVDANFTHLFRATQKRAADLTNNGGLSRYVLAAKVADGNLTGDLAPVANLLCCCETKVSIGIQADVAAMLNYTTGNYAFDLGYNFWYRSCERFRCKEDCKDSCDSSSSCGSTSCTCKEFDGKTWALHNTTFVGGEEPSFHTSFSKATIHALGAEDQNRVFLQASDIFYPRTRGLSHKVFAHLGYNWFDRENDEWIPYVGVGGEVEFGSGCGSSSSDCSCGDSCSTSSCKESCSSCIKHCSLSQWGVWVKGGISWS